MPQPESAQPSDLPSPRVYRTGDGPMIEYYERDREGQRKVTLRMARLAADADAAELLYTLFERLLTRIACHAGAFRGMSMAFDQAMHRAQNAEAALELATELKNALGADTELAEELAAEAARAKDAPRIKAAHEAAAAWEAAREVVDKTINAEIEKRRAANVGALATSARDRDFIDGMENARFSASAALFAKACAAATEPTRG